MSRWDDAEATTAQQAVRFWQEAPLDVLLATMDTGAWEPWLSVAARIVDEPGSVWDAGCGIGTLAPLLPASCTYVGSDVNPGYVHEAIRRHAAPGRRFEVRDLYEVLDASERITDEGEHERARFDWVIVTSLFGMFPEEESYRLIPRFWAMARRGLSITTVDRQVYDAIRGARHRFTSHRRDELLAAFRQLPGAEHVEVRRGVSSPSWGRTSGGGRGWSRTHGVRARDEGERGF